MIRRSTVVNPAVTGAPCAAHVAHRASKWASTRASWLEGQGAAAEKHQNRLSPGRVSQGLEFIGLGDGFGDVQDLDLAFFFKMLDPVRHHGIAKGATCRNDGGLGG
jgi:hypothetical protein